MVIRKFLEFLFSWGEGDGGGGSSDVLYCYHTTILQYDVPYRYHCYNIYYYLLALQINIISGRVAVNGIQAFSQQFAKIKHHLYIKSWTPITELRTEKKQTSLFIAAAPQMNLYCKNLHNYLFQVSGTPPDFSSSCTFACFLHADSKVFEQPGATAFVQTTWCSWGFKGMLAAPGL